MAVTRLRECPADQPCKSALHVTRYKPVEIWSVGNKRVLRLCSDNNAFEPTTHVVHPHALGYRYEVPALS